MKKLTSFLCGLSIICTMTACTEKPQESEVIPVTPIVSQTIYKSEEFPMPDDYNGLISLDYSAEKGTVLIYYNGDYEYLAQYYDENLNPTEKISLRQGKLEYGTRAYVAPDSTIHLVTIYGEYDGDAATDYEEYYANAEPKIEIYSYNSKGEEIGYLNVEDIADSFNLMNSITDMIYCNEKYILNFFDNKYVIDKNGIMTEFENEMNTVYAVDTEGRLVASRWEDYCFVDESLKYSDNPIEFGEYIRRSGEIFTGAGDYSLFAVMQRGIYGITADGQVLQLLDFAGSRVTSNTLYDYAYVGEGKFAAFYSGDMGETAILLMTVRPDDYVETREKVVLALDGINTTIDDLAGTFNKSNDEYEVEIRNYEYGTDALRADVLSDNSPDIYCYSDLDTVQSYTNIGAFADMYELMDTYGGLSREDIMPNVLEAYETGGKLYFMSNTFFVNCNIAWSEVLGREYSNWTLDEFFEVVENMPENMYIGDKWSFDSRHGLFSYLCRNNVEQWVDFDNNTCDFTSESFIKMLKLCRDLKLVFDEMPDYQNMTQEETAALEEMNAALLRNKEALLGWSGGSIGNLNFSMYAQLYGYGMEDVTLVANPTKNGGGTINGGECYSVLKSGNCTEGGWAYMCWLLGQRQQEEVGRFMFPVRKETFYKYTEQRQKMSANSKGSNSINGLSYEYDGTITEEQYEYIIGFIEKCNSLGGFRSKVGEILDDEYKSFAAGEVTAEECAERIQSRMEIYLSENS